MGAALLATLAVGGAVLWNLRSGFADYLREREVAQLERFAPLVAQRVQADPSMAWLADPRQAMQALIAKHHTQEGLATGDTDPADDHNEPPRHRRPHPPDAPPRPPPPPPPVPEGSIAERIQILDIHGTRLAGRPQRADGQKVLRPVIVQGTTVAYVQLTLARQPVGVDAGFLRRQYVGLGSAAAAVLVLAWLAAWWVARRWSRPLRALQTTAQRMARGDWTAPSPTTSGAAEIVNLRDDLVHMGQSLAHMDRSRKMWIAQISHELRTPLSVLQGEIEALQDGIRQPTPAMLASLREEVLQLARLVGDLHTLLVADLGRLPISPAPGDTNLFLRTAKQGLALTWLDSPTPIAAGWDFGRIEQLLCNLLENALRYTASPGRIHVRWHASAGIVQLSVQDSAPSVSPEHPGHLFEPLYRVDSARTRAAAPQRRHAQLGAGPVDCTRHRSSTPRHHRGAAQRDRGAGYPRATATQPLPCSCLMAPSLLHDRTMTAHILIVEDDAKIADMVANYLHASGYTTHIVADGLLAVQTARDTAPALVLLDLMLPGLDGMAVRQPIHSFCATPIIMVTACVEEVDKLLGLDIGADDYICKPFSPRELVARVKALLRRAAPPTITTNPAQESPTSEACFRVDSDSKRVFWGTQPLPLTMVEYRLFAKLHSRAGHVLSRQQLIDSCFDDFRDTSDRTVDSHIKNLRKKIDTVRPQGSGITSVYGAGYRFEV